MPPNEGLSIQEARDLIQQRNERGNAVEAIPSGSAPPTSSMPKRAPPWCTNCGIQGYKRTRCPADLIN